MAARRRKASSHAGLLLRVDQRQILDAALCAASDFGAGCRSAVHVASRHLGAALTAEGLILCMPAGVYVHLPFCPYICPYCDFAKWPHRRSAAARYLQALYGEILHR